MPYAAFATPVRYADPLEADSIDDEKILVSRRALARLALVASETATRFERDGIAHDPMAWILAPRRLFGGRAALDASLNLGDCTRAVLLHGLALGLDAAPGEIDELIEDDPDGTAAAFVPKGADRVGTMAV